MAKIKQIALVLGFVASSSLLDAQPPRIVRHGDERLKGITAVDVVVDPLAEDAARCGLARDALQQVTLKQLAAAGIKTTLSQKASSWFYTVYVTLTTVAPARQCATSIVTELMAEVEGIPEADRQASNAQWGSVLVGQMSLIRHQGVVSSPRSAHTLQVHDMVRDHVKAIGAKIVAANK